MLSYLLTLLSNLLLHILSCGPVPTHVAFIMDGNRRYARKRSEEVHEGHRAGYDSLQRVLETCLRLHITHISIYAFALDNFHRPPSEVTALLSLAKGKLGGELAEKGELLDRYGVKLNVVGRKDRFEDVEVRKGIQRAEELTKHNTQATLNICLAYASSDELTSAVQSSIRNTPSTQTITKEDIEKELDISPPVDILVRSSGVNRLSDFMLWQCCENTQIHFCKPYWPDFGFWDLVPIILDYQRKVWSSS